MFLCLVGRTTHKLWNHGKLLSLSDISQSFFPPLTSHLGVVGLLGDLDEDGVDDVGIPLRVLYITVPGPAQRGPKTSAELSGGPEALLNRAVH